MYSAGIMNLVTRAFATVLITIDVKISCHISPLLMFYNLPFMSWARYRCQLAFVFLVASLGRFVPVHL